MTRFLNDGNHVRPMAHDELKPFSDAALRKAHVPIKETELELQSAEAGALAPYLDSSLQVL